MKRLLLIHRIKIIKCSMQAMAVMSFIAMGITIQSYALVSEGCVVLINKQGSVIPPLLVEGLAGTIFTIISHAKITITPK